MYSPATVFTQVRNPERATQVSIIPSHHRVWIDGAMTRWYDSAMAMVRGHDDDDAIVLWQ